MHSDFFRINLPYGIEKTTEGEWFAFNRDYLPIGWNGDNEKTKKEDLVKSLPIYTKYKLITEKFLKELAWDDEDGILTNEKGEVVKVWLYNDGTNPVSNNKYWESYFDKLEKLSKLNT